MCILLVYTLSVSLKQYCMIKLYLHLHSATLHFKKQFLRTGFLLFLVLYAGSATKAQCDVNPVASQTVCNNTAITAIQFTGTATSYNWTNNTPSIGLAASGTGDIAAFNALNALTTTITATITVTPVSAACTGTPISFAITVNPSPVIVVTPNTTCGGPCNSMTASGADIYTWSPITGLFTDCGLSQAYTGTNVATVYTSPSGNGVTMYTATGQKTTTGCFGLSAALPNYQPLAPVVVPNPAFLCLSDPPVQLTVVKGTGSVNICSGSPLNIVVPDNNPAGASSSIQVSNMPASCPVTGVRVLINMTHTRMGNMVFVLKAPNGQIINLDYHLSTTGGAGTTTGFNNTMISSSGIIALSSGISPYTGTFKADLVNAPAGGFGAAGPTGMIPTTTNWATLFPTGVNGTWTLGFYDGVTGDVGTLNSWCLYFDYDCPSTLPPSTPAVWTPATGLYTNATATVPYVPGTGTDVVYARPIPAGVYPYQVTTSAIPTPMCAPATNFVNNNTAGLVTFNIRNNHAFPIRLYQINSRTATASQTAVSVYYKPAAVNGLPGLITPGNGWNQIGYNGIAGTGTGVQNFISNLSLVIPPGSTYGICLLATDVMSNTPNLAYSALAPGNYSFNDNGCELITGTNIGYSGTATVPGATTALSGFIGSIRFVQTTATCVSPPTTVVVNVSQSANITAQPVNQNICLGSAASFNVTMGSSGPFNYQWQLATAAGGPWANLINAGVYSGVNTGTLLINIPALAMSGNYYRVVINGGSGCSGAISNAALLTVNPLPNIVIVANPLIIGPTQTTTIFSTVTPNAAATYTWYYNNSVLPGEVLPNLVVNYGSPGDYQLKVTDVNGCTNLSNMVTIANSFALNLYTYPNPSDGLFELRYTSPANSMVQRSLLIYNNRGERVVTRNFTQTIPYQKIDVDIRANGKGLYWVELRDADGKRLALNRVVVQ